MRVVSMRQTWSLNSILAPSCSSTRAMVRVSARAGTLRREWVPGASRVAAITGRAAFLAPLPFPRPPRAPKNRHVRPPRPRRPCMLAIFAALLALAAATPHAAPLAAPGLPGPVVLTHAAADTIRRGIEKDREQTREWLKTSPT